MAKTVLLASALALVVMIRDAAEHPPPHRALVAETEVSNFAPAGWTVAEDQALTDEEAEYLEAAQAHTAAVALIDDLDGLARGQLVEIIVTDLRRDLERVSDQELRDGIRRARRFRAGNHDPVLGSADGLLSEPLAGAAQGTLLPVIEPGPGPTGPPEPPPPEEPATPPPQAHALEPEPKEPTEPAEPVSPPPLHADGATQGVEIPANWQGLHWTQRVRLAKDLGAEDDLTGETANAYIEAEVAKRAAAENGAGA